MTLAAFAARVAAHLEPGWDAAAHATGPGLPRPADVQLWAAHVAEVARTLRAAAIVGGAAPREASTLLAVTGMTEGELLIAVAEHHDAPEVAAQLEAWLGELRATGTDGRPLIADPTAPMAIVVDLSTRRTS